MRLAPRVATLLAVAALPLALTACSSGSSSDTGGASAAPSKAKDPNAGLATGTQLKKALAAGVGLPRRVRPRGRRRLGLRRHLPRPVRPQQGEAGLHPAGGHVLDPGDRLQGGVSFAQNDYVNHGKTEEIAQEIDAFQGTTATAVMKQMQAVADECATFTDTDAHAKVKLTGTSTAGLGDEAYTMTLTSGAWENGTTLLAVRSGNSVITVLSTAGSDNGAASAKKVTTRILDSLKALKTA